MIASLSGTIRHKDLQALVVDIGGIGHKVFVPTDVTLDAQVGEPVFLWTHLAVRETALDLFGFPERELLELFELLITIPGIGPKTALGILNVATPTMLRQAVSSGDTSYLTKVSGIGKKNAEKIVLELKDKLHVGEESAPAGKQAQVDSDVIEALVSLGYTERDSRGVLKELPADLETASERVKYALKLLSSN